MTKPREARSSSVMMKYGKTIVLVIALSSCIWQVPRGWADDYYRVLEPRDARDQPYAPPSNPKLCETYLANVNYFARKNQPLSCRRPIAAHFKDLANVSWRPFEISKHRVLFDKLARRWFCKEAEGRDLAVVDACVKSVEARHAKGEVMLFLAAADLDGDDRTEQILQYRSSWSCEPSRKPTKQHYPRPSFFLVDDSLTDFVPIQAGPRDALFIYRGRAYGEEYDPQTGSIWVTEGDLPAKLGRPEGLSSCEKRFLPEQCPGAVRPEFHFFRVCELAFRAPK